MTKEQVLLDIQALIQEIDKNDFLMKNAVFTKDADKIKFLQFDNERLLVKAHQELSFLYDYIKEGGNDED